MRKLKLYFAIPKCDHHLRYHYRYGALIVDFSQENSSVMSKNRSNWNKIFLIHYGTAQPNYQETSGLPQK